MITKIGKYYYETIPEDKNGEPKIDYGEEEDLRNLFTLVDYDGETIKTFRRIRKPKVFKD